MTMQIPTDKPASPILSAALPAAPPVIAPAAPPPVLDYVSRPAPWKIWALRGYRAAAFLLVNAVAALVALVLVSLLPVLAAWVAYFAYAAHESAASQPVASPRELVAASGILQAGGMVLAIPVLLAGFFIDLVRRLLRRGWWLTLAAVIPLILLATLAITALCGLTPGQILAASLTTTLLLTLLFCAYWIPLGCIELLRHALERLALRRWHRPTGGPGARHQGNSARQGRVDASK